DAGLTAAFEAIRMAFQRAIDANILLVAASGNVDQGPLDSDPWFFPNLVDFGPDSLGGLITVGAVNRANETMTWFAPDGTTVRTANKAGAAQDHFLVAPSDVIMVKQDGTTTTFRRPGTSNSAPHVAGVAALLAQAFPNLTGQEIGQILLATAIDLGAPGPDPIFGMGLVNITGAMAPIGTTTVQLAGGDVFALSGTTATVSAAFGDAFSIAGPLSSVMMLDSFERSFMFDLGAKVNALAARGINFEALLGREHQLYSLDLSLGATGSFGFSFYDAERGLKAISHALPMAIRSAMALTRPQMFFQGRFGDVTSYGFSYGLSVRQVLDRQNPDFAPAGAFLLGRAFSQGYLGFAEGVQSFGLTRHLSTATSLSLGVSMARYDGDRFLNDGRGDPSTAIDSVMRLSHQKGKLSLTATGGVLTEKHAILGSRSAGALKLGGGAETFYGRMGASYSLGSGRQFFASVGRGLTSVSGAASSFVTGVSSFQTSSYAFGFVDREVFTGGDMLGIAISQPLKVENGNISFSLPTGRDYIADRILFTDSRSGLAPSGRELDLELVYRWRMGGVSLAAGALASWNAGHAKENRFGGAIMIQTSARF
ncbi:MAG: S8 family serine peptidase, partial [Sphingomonadales bacterium]